MKHLPKDLASQNIPKQCQYKIHLFLSHLHNSEME